MHDVLLVLEGSLFEEERDRASEDADRKGIDPVFQVRLLWVDGGSGRLTAKEMNYPERPILAENTVSVNLF